MEIYVQELKDVYNFMRKMSWYLNLGDGVRNSTTFPACPAETCVSQEMLGSDVQIQLDQIQRAVNAAKKYSVFPQSQVK